MQLVKRIGISAIETRSSRRIKPDAWQILQNFFDVSASHTDSIGQREQNA